VGVFVNLVASGSLSSIQTSRVVPCGHAFSPEGLHSLFQNAIYQELCTDRHEILRPYRKFGIARRVPPAYYVEDDLRDFTKFSIYPFTPTYSCPLCKTLIKRPPIVSMALNALVEQTVRLALQDNPSASVTVVDGLGDIHIDWAIYFLFYS